MLHPSWCSLQRQLAPSAFCTTSCLCTLVVTFAAKGAFLSIVFVGHHGTHVEEGLSPSSRLGCSSFKHGPPKCLCVAQCCTECFRARATYLLIWPEHFQTHFLHLSAWVRGRTACRTSWAPPCRMSRPSWTAASAGGTTTGSRCSPRPCAPQPQTLGLRALPRTPRQTLAARAPRSRPHRRRQRCELGRERAGWQGLSRVLRLAAC